MTSLIKKSYDIEKISVSGQIFRFNKINDTTYELIERDKRIRIEDNGKYWAFGIDKKAYNKFYKKYFDDDNKLYNNIKNPYYYIENSLSKKDKFLKECVAYGKGIRILRQDPFEMLISFIISQRKSIKAIKTSIEKLCKLCGKKKKDKYGIYYAFPTAKEILDKKDELSKCSLGYRVEYVIDACEKVVSKNIKLYDKNIDSLSDDKLIAYLTNIKGVGIKVASCVSLFAYHRLSICPIDVWIKRVLDKYYDGKVPKKYEKYAGLIQQYWFIKAQNKA